MYVIITTHLNINVGHLHTTLLLQLFYGPLSRTIWMSRYQKNIHPLTYPDHHPIFISLFHILQSIASSLFNLRLRAWQSFCTTLSKSSLVYLLVCSPPPHTPYISLPNLCLLFATHAHTIAVCFVELLSFTLTSHIHLTILISAVPKCHLVFFHDRPGLTSM